MLVIQEQLTENRRKDELIATKDRQLATKDEQIATKDREMATKDEQIATKNRELATKDIIQINQIRVIMETRLQVWELGRQGGGGILDVSTPPNVILQQSHLE